MNKKMSKKKTISFGMAPFTTSFLLIAYNWLVFYYYEVELGLATALVGLAFVIFAIWDMINDPLIGYLTDKPRKWTDKYGLRMPWIIIGGILQALFWFLIFIPPDVDPKVNPYPLFVYMVIIICLFDTAFSMFQANYWSAFSNIYRTPEERRKGGTIITFISIGGRILLGGLLLPRLIILGDKSSYIRAGLICSIIIVICILSSIYGFSENEEMIKRALIFRQYNKMMKVSLLQILKIAFKERNWTIWLISFTLWTTAFTFMQISVLYYVIDVLGGDILVFTATTLIFTIILIPSLIIFFKISKRIEQSNLVIVAFMIVILESVSFLFINSISVYLIFNSIMGVALGAWLVSIYPITSDVNDSVCLSAGRHIEATLIGIRNFFISLGYAITGVVIAYIHITTGYQPGVSEQTEMAKLGIRIHMGLIPAIFQIIALILMIKFYDLKGDKKIIQLINLEKSGL